MAGVRRAILLITALLLSGCAEPPAPLNATVAPTPMVTPPQSPYILHIPGVSGESIVDHSLRNGLTQSFAPVGGAQIEIYDWTENDPGIPALQAYKRNHAEAKKIAEMIQIHLAAHPDQTIDITCHSGGAGLVAWALEDLPPNIQVDRVVFIAPALSRTYDLSRALSHVKTAAYVFWSSGDYAILSAGTKVFGTIDGVYDDAAGFAGFEMPAQADVAQYAKLHQIPY